MTVQVGHGGPARLGPGPGAVQEVSKFKLKFLEGRRAVARRPAVMRAA